MPAANRNQESVRDRDAARFGVNQQEAGDIASYNFPCAAICM